MFGEEHEKTLYNLVYPHMHEAYKHVLKYDTGKLLVVAGSSLTGVAELCHLKQDILSSAKNEFNPGSVQTLLKKVYLGVKHQDKQYFGRIIINGFLRNISYFVIQL